MTASKPRPTEVNYQAGRVPEWVRRAIDEQMAIEQEDARSAGSLGYMTRALVLATMPYKDPKADAFSRTNGDFTLRIVAGYEGGIPYGIYPRLLMSWLSTEAVRTQSPHIELGDSLRSFLRDVMEIRSDSGGSRSASSRVAEQMKRLFGSLITAKLAGEQPGRGFILKNILIADDLHLADENSFDLEPAPTTLIGGGGAGVDGQLWTPQKREQAGKWKSSVMLGRNFFNELIEHPIPIDLRAYKALRGSPLAMDIYSWLTYRMSYTNKPTRPIVWESLMMQFGSNFSPNNPEQATRDFKKGFLAALKAVQIVYPKARLEVRDNGLVLLPSPPHVSRLPGDTRQGSLFK